jgi:hypothetical protein
MKLLTTVGTLFKFLLFSLDLADENDVQFGRQG